MRCAASDPARRLLRARARQRHVDQRRHRDAAVLATPARLGSPTPQLHRVSTRPDTGPVRRFASVPPLVVAATGCWLSDRAWGRILPAGTSVVGDGRRTVRPNSAREFGRASGGHRCMKQTRLCTPGADTSDARGVDGLRSSLRLWQPVPLGLRSRAQLPGRLRTNTCRRISSPTSRGRGSPTRTW